MLVTIKEHVWRDITLRGMPVRTLHTFALGAHAQKQYDIPGAVMYDRRVSETGLARLREQVKFAALRTRELRKAVKHGLTITFHVEHP